MAPLLMSQPIQRRPSFWTTAAVEADHALWQVVVGGVLLELAGVDIGGDEIPGEAESHNRPLLAREYAYFRLAGERDLRIPRVGSRQRGMRATEKAATSIRD